MAETNYGISGVGSLSAHNLVVGPSGTINEYAMPAEVQAQLDELRAAVSAFAGDAGVREQITAATHEVASELASPAPDKPKLRDRLSAIAQAAGSASAVASAATGLITLIATLI